MAINSQKLLPPGRLTAGERMAAAYDKKIDDLLNLKVKKKLINVDKFIGNTKKTKEKTQKVKKKKEENKKRKEKEDRLEKAKSPGVSALNLPNLPKTGILDSISNFVQYTFLGYLLYNYGNKIGGLGSVVKTVVSGLETVSNLVIGTVDVSASIIKGIYDTKDKLSNQVEQLGGKDAKKTFDNFTTGFKDMINKIMSLGLYQPPVPQKTNGGMVQKMAVGGNVTRAGRPVGGAVSRSISVIKSKPKIKIKPQLTQPGKDVGGKKKIQKLFPDPTDSPTPDSRAINPLRSLKTTSKNLKQIPFLGGIMGAAVDLAMGQKPDKGFYRSFGNSIGALVQNSIDNQTNLTVSDISKTVFAMANGGSVSRGITRQKTTGEEIGMQIARMFEISLNSRVNQIFNQIIKEMGGTPSEMPDISSYDTGLVTVDSNSPDFWLLAVGALLENSHPQGAADVAQVIYNRIASPSWPNSIRSVIMEGNGGQFQPVRDYGTINAWNSIKDKNSAIKFIQQYGKGRSQAQLETVAAALLDPIRQRSSSTFVGPRDSFRAISFENRNDHLADDTEQRRHGHVFGFEPAGAQIGSFRSGKLRPALISPAVQGSVKVNTAPGVLSKNQTVTVEGNFSLRQDAARAYLDMKRAAAAEGVNITLESAWRDSSVQAKLYHLFKKGLGNLAAPPGTSNHEKGIAIDLASGIAWAQRNGSRFGWINTGMTFSQPEPWHFDFDPRYYKPSPVQTKTRKGQNVAAQPTTQPASIASTPSGVSNVSQQVAMTPSYADGGQNTVFILQEKIVMSQGNSPVNFPGIQQSIMNPSVNSRIPMSVG